MLVSLLVHAMALAPPAPPEKRKDDTDPTTGYQAWGTDRDIKDLVDLLLMMK